MKSERSLSPQVVKGGAWLFGGRVIDRVFTLVKVIVLARLLLPEDFGLFGIVALAVSTAEALSRSGMHEALVQRRELMTAHLNTAWTVRVVRGVVLAGLLFGAAPLLADFFGRNALAPLLRLMAAGIVLRGAGNIGIIYFQKELRLHRQFLYEVCAGFVSLATAVILAYKLRNVWAFVWASLAREVVRLLLSYALHPYRPHFQFSLAEARELVGFGRWFFAGGIVDFVFQNVDDALVGKLLGMGSLGIYQMAYKMPHMPLSQVDFVSNRVLFPAYAHIHKQAERFRAGFKTALENVLMIGMPAAAMIAFFAPELVRYTVGSKWEPVVELVPVLSVAILFRLVARAGGPVVAATGNPQHGFVTQCIRIGVLSVTIVPLLFWLETLGVCISIAIAEAATLPHWWWKSSRFAGATASDKLQSLRIPVVGTLLLLGPPALAVLVFGRGIVVLGPTTVVGAALCLLLFLKYKGQQWMWLVKNVLGHRISNRAG